MLSELNEQRDLILTCLNMWWASVVLLVLEVVLAVIIVSRAIMDERARRDNNYKWTKEYVSWLKAYLILN